MAREARLNRSRMARAVCGIRGTGVSVAVTLTRMKCGPGALRADQRAGDTGEEVEAVAVELGAGH